MRSSGFILALIVLAAIIAGVACDDDSTERSAPGPSATNTDRASPAGGSAATTTELVERLTPSVVHILSEAATLDFFGQVVPREGVGTGFIVDEKGHIVTNNHVVTIGGEPAASIVVTLSDGRRFPAQIVGRDPPTDLAVLKIEAEELQPVQLGKSSALEVGQDVIAIGNALNLAGGPTVTKGVVSALGRLIEEGDITIPDAIQTDASINPGNSGGPLLNLQGEVVGITTAVIRGVAEGIGLAISSDSARPVIEELIREGRVIRGFLGVTIAPVTASLAQRCGATEDEGVLLTSVQAGSPAEQAGLEQCDVIVGLGGIDVGTTGDLFAALRQHRSGAVVEVEYFRGGGREMTEVTLG